jgi:hypothetical protein
MFSLSWKMWEREESILAFGRRTERGSMVGVARERGRREKGVGGREEEGRRKRREGEMKRHGVRDLQSFTTDLRIRIIDDKIMIDTYGSLDKRELEGCSCSVRCTQRDSDRRIELSSGILLYEVQMKEEDM